jgi:hypothetical protein
MLRLFSKFCHKKKIYWDLSESLLKECATSVLWDFRERGNIKSITISELWCPEAESNHRHEDFQSSALPTELSGQKGLSGTPQKRLDVASQPHARRVLNPSRGDESRPSLLLRGNIALGAVEVGAGKKLVHLLLQVFTVIGVSHAQLLLIDKHGLVTLPFAPGLLRNIQKQFLAFFSRIGRRDESGEVLLELAAEYCA